MATILGANQQIASFLNNFYDKVKTGSYEREYALRKYNYAQEYMTENEEDITLANRKRFIDLGRTVFPETVRKALDIIATAEKGVIYVSPNHYDTHEFVEGKKYLFYTPTEEAFHKYRMMVEKNLNWGVVCEKPENYETAINYSGAMKWWRVFRNQFWIHEGKLICDDIKSFRNLNDLEYRTLNIVDPDHPKIESLYEKYQAQSDYDDYLDDCMEHGSHYGDSYEELEEWRKIAKCWE